MQDPCATKATASTFASSTDRRSESIAALLTRLEDEQSYHRDMAEMDQQHHQWDEADVEAQQERWK